MNVPVPESPGQSGDDEPAHRPGVVHAHPEVDLPLARADFHGPDEGGGVAGDGHGAGDPPGEDEAPVVGHDGGDQAEYQHGHRGAPDGCLAAKPVGDKAGTEGAQSKA